MKFYCRFDVAPSLNKDKVYDIHDNVDRVSYVDSTRLVERFILEGHNLNEVRAKALRSGLYSGDLSEIQNDDSIPIPVYDMDPAVASPIIDELKSRMSKKKAENATTISNDDANSSASLPKTGLTDNNSEKQ